MKDEKDFREELEARLAAATEDLRAAEAQVTRLKRRVEGFKEVLASFAEPRPRPGTGLLKMPFPTKDRSLSRMTIKDAAKTVIQEYGEPMTAREIFDAMVARGKTPGGKSPIETLRAILRTTDDTFKKTPDSKWALADSEAEFIEAMKAFEDLATTPSKQEEEEQRR